MSEPAGTVLLGSLHKRAYLYLSQSAERMEIERQNARDAGVQDIVDFVFELDGQRIQLDYRTLKKRLTDEDKKVLLALIREGIACGSSASAFLRWIERAKFIIANAPAASSQPPPAEQACKPLLHLFTAPGEPCVCGAVPWGQPSNTPTAGDAA